MTNSDGVAPRFGQAPSSATAGASRHTSVPPPPRPRARRVWLQRGALSVARVALFPWEWRVVSVDQPPLPGWLQRLESGALGLARDGVHGRLGHRVRGTADDDPLIRILQRCEHLVLHGQRPDPRVQQRSEPPAVHPDTTLCPQPGELRAV